MNFVDEISRRRNTRIRLTVLYTNGRFNQSRTEISLNSIYFLSRLLLTRTRLFSSTGRKLSGHSQREVYVFSKIFVRRVIESICLFYMCNLTITTKPLFLSFPRYCKKNLIYLDTHDRSFPP